MKDYNKTFALNLAIVRIGRNMTQKELAEKANLRTQKRIDQIERCAANVDLKEVVSICSVLNVDIDKMLNWSAEIKIDFQSKDPVTGKIL